MREHVKSQLGFKHSPETIKRFSDKLRGRVKSPEEREKLRLAKLGTKQPAEVRAKIAKPFKLVSPQGKPVIGRNLRTLCLANKLDISAMAKVNKGQRPSYKGWTAPDARRAHLADHPLTIYEQAKHVCPECSEEFTDKLSARRKFCSKACRAVHDGRAYSGTGNPNYRHGHKVKHP